MNQILVEGRAVFSSYYPTFPAWVLHTAFELLHISHLDHSLELCHLYWSEEDKIKRKKKKKVVCTKVGTGNFEFSSYLCPSIPYNPEQFVILGKASVLIVSFIKFCYLNWWSLMSTSHLLSRHTNEQKSPHVIVTQQSVDLEIKLIARNILKHNLIEVKISCCLIK